MRPADFCEACRRPMHDGRCADAARIAELEAEVERCKVPQCAGCDGLRLQLGEARSAIAARDRVIEAAKEIPTTDLGPGPYVYVNIRELEALGKALANLRRVEEGK